MFTDFDQIDARGFSGLPNQLISYFASEGSDNAGDAMQIAVTLRVER